MKKTFALFLLSFLLSTTVTFGQAGTTIEYEDNLTLGATLIPTYNGLINGKHSYTETVTGDNITVTWSGTRWEINCCGTVLIAHSDAVTLLNPPNSAVGGWILDDPASGFVIVNGSGTSDTVLPVELIGFWVVKQDESLEVKWQTASEINNEKFEIEMSQDGRDFQKVGEVKGNGTMTSALSNYSFLITNPSLGLSYYRLKQIDFDGQFEYSDVVSVRFEKEGEPVGTFFPNPSGLGLVNLNLSSEESKVIQITVFNISGKLLNAHTRQLEKGNNQLYFDFSFLEQGIYVIQLGDNEDPTYRKLIIK